MNPPVLTFDLFRNRVGQVWVVDEPDTPPIEFTLTEAEPLTNYAKLAREPFSLIFSAPGGVMPQRSYDLRHDALGPMAIFLVPVGRTDDGTIYQGVFN